jgi:predicted SnoaL-like aldol condensation-catalyzing enzyme
VSSNLTASATNEIQHIDRKYMFRVENGKIAEHWDASPKQ